jgi:hypothetical protein
MTGIINFLLSTCVSSDIKIKKNVKLLCVLPLRTHECITFFVSLCGRHFEWRELSEQQMHPSVTIVLLINRLYLVTREERSQLVGQSDDL